MPAARTSGFYLVVLVFSQFAGTSLWFAGNAIIDQLSVSSNHASVTAFVQFGFITGTLVFSLLTIADRFSAKKVFFISAVLAALANLLIIWLYRDAAALKLLRFLTGFFLAGIYPVGMKIAALLFPEKMGRALGFLVGALVMGTAFPHFVRSGLVAVQWETVLLTTSLLAVFGGLLIIVLLPATDKNAAVPKPDFGAAFQVFQLRSFRSAAFGYFGHMWELYALWSMLPVVITYYNSTHGYSANANWWSFLVIAIGGLGCVLGGFLSLRWGSRKVAFTALALSGLCCLVAPFFFRTAPVLFFSLLLFWGLVISPDSPQFSALVARAAADKHKGTALTIVTSAGFAITIISILLLQKLFAAHKEFALWLLAPGPALGLVALKKLK